MSRTRELYRAEQLSIFQNRMFASEALARGCTRGDLILVQDGDTGLVYNQAFDPALMVYDADYQKTRWNSGRRDRPESAKQRKQRVTLLQVQSPEQAVPRSRRATNVRHAWHQ